jgi:hypothetical protein
MLIYSSHHEKKYTSLKYALLVATRPVWLRKCLDPLKMVPLGKSPIAGLIPGVPVDIIL